MKNYFIRNFSPYGFLFGILSAFLILWQLGNITTKINVFGNTILRFQRLINLETLYYPTVSQIESLVLSPDSKDKITVVIGGSSVMHGVGQSQDELWSRDLQERLGSQYRVINLGMRGGSSGEVGAIATEILLRKHRKVIYVMDHSLFHVEPDKSLYAYLFFEAYHQKNLLNLPLSFVELYKKNPELSLRAYLNSRLHFNDFWNYVGYNYFFTIWNSVATDSRKAGEHFYRARKKFIRSDYVHPSSYYTPSRDFPLGVERIKDTINKKTTLAQSYSNHIKLPSFAFLKDIQTHGIILAVYESPYYRDPLSTQEQQGYHETKSLEAKLLKNKAGIAVAQTLGKYWKITDYVDRVHISPQGGKKLSKRVAKLVQELAKEKGYI